ncbi:F-box domain-containing protein [Mycena indigotica]|uniref:F-box domain-containing protein n=1 Tax=Mycena indigotica TaxID=2126181 RepID=A0A8H6WJY5_9AGAR|nr:F-box domain-containing protein [Mycena indigotica]KAF7315069.1 F-box domain-containing protein [Mycena indigotica]
MMTASETTILAKRLVSDNKKPTPTENEILQAVIPGLRMAVQALEAQLNEIEIALAISPGEVPPDAKLVKQRETVQQELNAVQDVLALHMQAITVAQQIPIEVLETIFTLTLPDTDFISPSRTEAPLLLCQISSAWRNVALATPALWSSLSLSLDRRPGTWKNLVETWLDRSRDCPLAISFTMKRDRRPGPPSPKIDYFNNHVVQMFRPSARRWKRLRLDAPIISTLLSTSLPSLEYIELNTQDNFQGVFLSTASIPRLTKVVIVGAESNPARIYLPYSRLTELHIMDYFCGLDEVYHILYSCKNLLHCTVRIHPRSEASLQDHPLHLPCLSSLVIRGSIGWPGVLD